MSGSNCGRIDKKNSLKWLGLHVMRKGDSETVRVPIEE